MSRRLALTLLTILAIAGLARRFVNRTITTEAATLTVGNAQSFLVILGAADTSGANWDGSVTVTGSTVQIVRGWRFTGTDAVTNNTWKMSTRTSPTLNPPGPVQENGVIVKVTASASPITFEVNTTQGNFKFLSTDVPFGVTKSFLGGKALVMQTGAQFQLTSSSEEEDFPVIAQSGDDVFLTYTEFVHGDRTQATGQGTPAPITDFSFLARPAGGDQVMLMHYSIAQRIWTGPFPVTAPGEDIMRSTVAIDGRGRAWIFYSAQRNGNFDIYARNATADGAVSDEIAITTDPGTDLFPAAATDAAGNVWLTWQAFRNNNLEILATVQSGDTFLPETLVSTSAASDWDPAIAAAPNGDVAISWDTYDKGDYDVYLRRVYTDSQQITMDTPIPIAATREFEARSSLAYDRANRLWIAYEVAGERWGKDFGAFDTTGFPLYGSHTIQVVCLIGNDLYKTASDVARVLPGVPANHMFATPRQSAYAILPDPALSGKRTPNAGVGPPAGPRNSFPRLATDAEGTVYLAFRQLSGQGMSASHATGGLSVGSIWLSSLVYFDGAVWHGPGILGFTDSVGDNRPSIVALRPGHLLIAHSSDHRLSPGGGTRTPATDPVGFDVFQSDLTIGRTQQTPKLTKIGQITPADPDPSVAGEQAANAFGRSYQPSLNGQPLTLVRGDFHRHTEISFDGRGDGPLIDAYRYYIDAAGLGWAGCCDHDNGEAREYTWWLNQKFTDAYALGTQYIPMFYYERSVNYPEGHRNIVFAQRGVRTLPRLPAAAPASPSKPTPDGTMLFAYLHFFNGISAPHTSATDQGNDWRNSDPVVEPFVEIYQGDRQDYEMPGAPRANTPTDSISGYEAAGYVSNALGKGLQLGFEASSDHISTHISFTNLWVTDPSRAGIMEAMHKRRMYGSTENIVADVSSGGHYMGESFTSSVAPVLNVKLFGTQPFQSVVVVKDNNVVYSTSGGKNISFTWQDLSAEKGKTSYYYVRGVQTDGNIVWVSPMWVTLQ
jgi:hypothetical protein